MQRLVEGLVEPGFGKVADAFARQLRRARRGRRGLLPARRGPASGRRVGRGRRRRHRQAVRGGHAPARVLHHEGRHRPVRQPAGAAGRARRRRPGRHVLARVRGRRARTTSPCGGCCATRPACPASTASSPSRTRWRGTRPIRALERQKPLWEPGTAHGYHARHLRLAGRRGRAPDQRPQPRHVLRRRARRPARPRLLDRPARRPAPPGGAAGRARPDRPTTPRSSTRRWRRCWPSSSGPTRCSVRAL